MKNAVVYWSGGGNTELMAKAVFEGMKENDSDAKLYEVNDFNASMVDDFEGIAFGCPAMGEEVLEEELFQPMFDECKAKLNGKKIALFGSYGWGDGEWMRNWEEDCKNAGANLIFESVICNEEPDDDALTECRELGAKFI